MATSGSTTEIQQLAINTIRTLSMDAVQQANSGHPGTPMALAPVAYSLWTEFLRYDPARPLWLGRDRFVLSCGHASMLLYSLIHLADVRKVDAEGNLLDEPALTLDDLKHFRQLGSPTPGHPEYHHTTGVETTTGPLGQGVATSVVMAMAGSWMANRYNQSGFKLFDYNVYALCSDGDLMEGISGEAASLAGHLRLGNLCWIYDDNKITIEGETSLAFSEDVAERFQAYGWHVVKVGDANDLEALRRSYQSFLDTNDRPTLIIVRSHIGWGSPHKQDSHEAHGAPLGADEVALTKKAYGWPEDKFFYVPDEVRENFASTLGQRGREASAAWQEMFDQYKKQYPELAEELLLIQKAELPAGWDADIPSFPADAKGVATRSASGKVLNAVAKHIPWMLGGSADLAPSNNTHLGFEGAGSFLPDNHGGRNLHFGIREHGMGAALNGMALAGLRPYGGTFLVFSDYMRPAIRLAALMRVPALYIFTHDSIGLGEDGPTHQPVEHLAALRAIPDLLVMRPGDANETAAAYRTILPIHDRPVALILTRQNLPTLDREKYAAADGVARGAYVLADSDNPQVILMATGSEVSLCVEAYEQLKAEGIAARVVSMPCWELFEDQDQAYRDSVLPPQVTARVAVETAVQQGWERYLGFGGRFIGMHSFGASAPVKDVMKRFGFTVDNVVAQAKDALGK